MKTCKLSAIVAVLDLQENEMHIYIITSESVKEDELFLNFL